MLYRLTSKGDLSAESVLKGHKVLKALVPYKDPPGISHFPRTGNIQSTDQSLNRGTREHSGFRAELPSSDTQPSAGMGNARWRSRGPATLACLRTDSTPHASSTSRSREGQWSRPLNSPGCRVLPTADRKRGRWETTGRLFRRRKRRKGANKPVKGK